MAFIMAAEAAKALDYSNEYVYGTAIPKRRTDDFPDESAVEIPSARESLQPAERTAVRRAPVLSLFSVFGALFVGALMIFAILAQISYNEVASETIRLNAQIKGLKEQERILEIKFESVIDMKEVERYARDVLGMSKPEAEQVAVIQSVQQDTAEIITNSGEERPLRGLGSFISSLAKYFKR